MYFTKAFSFSKILFLTLLFLSLLTRASVEQANTSPDLKDFHNTLRRFTREKFFFDPYKIQTYHIKKGYKTALVFFPGMGEPALKYWELADDLQDLAADIYFFDHLGHGLSDYLASGLAPRKVYTPTFDLYIESSKRYLNQLRPRYSKVIVLAHSMGAHIIAHILYQKPNLIDGVAMSAPMMEVGTFGLPHTWATSLLSLFIKETDFVPLQDTSAVPMEKRFYLSNSATRRALYGQIRRQHPQWVRSGATLGWTKAAFQSMDKLEAIEDFSPVQVPVVIFQAGQDKIVKNQGVNRFCQKLPRCEKYLYLQAQHEILNEIDPIRDSALNHVRSLFRKILGSQ